MLLLWVPFELMQKCFSTSAFILGIYWSLNILLFILVESDKLYWTTNVSFIQGSLYTVWKKQLSTVGLWGRWWSPWEISSGTVFLPHKDFACYIMLLGHSRKVRSTWVFIRNTPGDFTDELLLHKLEVVLISEYRIWSWDENLHNVSPPCLMVASQSSLCIKDVLCFRHPDGCIWRLRGLMGC